MGSETIKRELGKPMSWSDWYPQRSEPRPDCGISLTVASFSKKFTKGNASVSRSNEKDRADRWLLSNREREVLMWMVTGKTNLEIAQILGTSPNTVKHQVTKIFNKLCVTNRAQAGAVAIQRRIVPASIQHNQTGAEDVL